MAVPGFTASGTPSLSINPVLRDPVLRNGMTEARLVNTLTEAIDTFTEYCGRAIAWLTLAMIAITCTVVVMRYVLQSGSIALQESVTYLHACVFMLGIAFTLKRGGHVRVDIFYRRFAPRTKAWVDLIGTLGLFAPVMAVIFWLSIDYVGNSWAVAESSGESAGLPWVYLLKTLLLVMPVLVLLQGLAELLKSLHILLNPSSPRSPQA